MKKEFKFRESRRAKIIKNIKIKCIFEGACDNLRKTEKGEKEWQEMMKTKEEISEKEFLNNVNVRKILDSDEKWEDYKENAKKEGGPIKFYKSANHKYFAQRSGFEFIWKEHWVGNLEDYPLSNWFLKQGIKPKKDIDFDGDSVVDIEDCKWRNKNKQGILGNIGKAVSGAVSVVCE